MSPTYQTKTDIAAQHVREAILSGRYVAGDRLLLKELAGDLGLSITPVREALQKLLSEGLLKQDPHRGVHVADLVPVEVDELYLVRQALEPLATRLAADQITAADLKRLRELQTEMTRLARNGMTSEVVSVNHAIHQGIYAATRLPLLSSVIEQLWSRCPRDILSVLPRRAVASLKEHEDILEALEKHDGVRAESLMRTHLEKSRKSQVAYLRSTKRHMPARK